MNACSIQKSTRYEFCKMIFADLLTLGFASDKNVRISWYARSSIVIDRDTNKVISKSGYPFEVFEPKNDDYGLMHRAPQAPRNPNIISKGK